MADRRTSAFCSSERQVVTSRMLASRIFGLKTFMDRVPGAEDEDEGLRPRPGWARWCILFVQKGRTDMILMESCLPQDNPWPHASCVTDVAKRWWAV